MNPVLLAAGIVLSNIESWYCRLGHLVTPKPRAFGGHERRKNPRNCTLCNGPMRSNSRPPRDARMPDGTIRRLPEETLRWFRCSRCHRSQVGV